MHPNFRISLHRGIGDKLECIPVLHGIDMPITKSVVALLDKKQTLTELVSQLLTRSLKEE